jgi:hypothetical protein
MMMAGVAAEATRALYVHAMVHAYNLHVIRELVPGLCGVWCNDIPERATARRAGEHVVCEPPRSSLDDTIVRDVRK